MLGVLVRMHKGSKIWVFLALVWIATVYAESNMITSTESSERKLKSAVFRSPPFILGPGQVQDKFYLSIDFPKGHIAVKGFDAEVVDEEGNSIPLYETYLHHWYAKRFYRKVPLTEEQTKAQTKRLHSSNYIFAGNDGFCQNHSLGQSFGLGSETRHTSTFIPDPYGIVVGDPKQIPEGYEESWMLNVHAIDTRGVVNSLGCTECRCDLYNVTKDQYDRPLRENYIGGLHCCYDGTQCQLNEGFQGDKRTLYLEYTVYWMNWDESIVPVRTYLLDVTESYNGGCQVEFDVPPCSADRLPSECIYTREAHMVIPRGGDVIYAVAHQHTGGFGSVLYGQDGREICSSLPIYGQGREPGNETGYVVGMSTCYPEPGSVKIYNETLKLQSKYSNEVRHTGAMNLFYLLIADSVHNATVNSY